MFHTAHGIIIEGVESALLSDVFATTRERYGITEPQISEAAAFSFAMVVRHALGTFAKDGVVSALIGNSLAGAVVAGTLRHLANAGANVRAFVFDSEEAHAGTKVQLNILERLSLPIHLIKGKRELGDALDAFDGSHSILWALHGSPSAKSPLVQNIIERLNDHSVPVHALETPPGINEDSGEKIGPPLFASSTMSLGMVLKGLDKGRDYVGRHYLCDALIPARLYEENGLSIDQLFSEQPVIKIFPGKPEATEAAK